jgi:hypothetical protein
VSEAGLQGHNASLPPCVAAKCLLSMMGNGARADVGMPVCGHAAVAFGYEVEGCWHVYDVGLRGQWCLLATMRHCGVATRVRVGVAVLWLLLATVDFGERAPEYGAPVPGRAAVGGGKW